MTKLRSVCGLSGLISKKHLIDLGISKEDRGDLSACPMEAMHELSELLVMPARVLPCCDGSNLFQ